MALVTINLELYEFLKEVETHLIMENESCPEVKAIAFIPLDRLDYFMSIVGYSHFQNDGGYNVKLQDRCICIELNDIIENDGLDIMTYENCFDRAEVTRYIHALREGLIF